MWGNAQGCLKPEGDLGHHVCQLELDELGLGEGGDRTACGQGVYCRAACQQNSAGTEHAPGDAVSRLVEAAEGTRKALNIRQQVVIWHKGIVEDDFAGDGASQAHLAFDLGG